MGDLGQRELGREHLALLGHLHAARDRARRLRVDRPVRGTAAAAERAAAAVEEDPRDAVALELLGERDLGAVGRPSRGDVARVLVGVRVADHHLLLVPDRAQRAPVDGQIQQRAHGLGRVRERVLGLEQRDDPQPRALAAGLGQAALLHQQQHLEQVGGLLGTGDDVGLDRAGVAPAQQLAERAEGADDLLRRGRERAQIRRDQRPALGDLAREQRAALRGRERRVGLVDAERGEDLGDRRAVAVGVLADVEPREVEAEHLDLADRVVELGGGDELPLAARAARPERCAGRPAARRATRSRRRRPRASRARARRAGRSTAGRAPRDCGARARAASSGQRRGEPVERRLDLGRAVDEPVGQRDALGEQLDPGLEQVQAGASHHLERLRGDRGGDVRVAVAVAAHPGPEREQRRHRDLLARVGLLDRRLELAVELRHDAVQRRGEVDEPGVDLVERGGGGGAHLVGAPQLLDRPGSARCAAASSPGTGRCSSRSRRRAKMRASFSTVVRRRASVGWAVMTSRSSARASISRSSAAVVPRSARCITAARSDPAPRRAGARALAAAQAADALVVLGEVDELEPARERAHEHLGVVEREVGDERPRARAVAPWSPARERLPSAAARSWRATASSPSLAARTAQKSSSRSVRSSTNDRPPR